MAPGLRPGTAAPMRENSPRSQRYEFFECERLSHLRQGDSGKIDSSLILKGRIHLAKAADISSKGGIFKPRFRRLLSARTILGNDTRSDQAD
jgi:hypothetical protein